MADSDPWRKFYRVDPASTRTNLPRPVNVISRGAPEAWIHDAIASRSMTSGASSTF